MNSPKPALEKPTREDWLWIAAYLESEGTFRAYEIEAKSISSGPEPVIRLARLLGGNIDEISDPRPNHRGGWRWRCSGEKARFAMRTLLVLKREGLIGTEPVMSLKRRQAMQEILDRWDRRNGTAPETPKPPEGP